MPMPSTLWTAILQVREDPERVKDLVVRRYRAPVYEFALHCRLSPEDADDVTQEVFVRVCRKEFLERADREKGKFRSFLLAVTRHVIDAHRRRENAGVRDRRRTLPLDDLDIPGNVQPESEFDRLWAKNLVEKALERLGGDITVPAYRLKVQGKSNREIALELGKSETDVRNYVHRATLRLRREIKKMISEYSSPKDLPEEIRSLRRFL